MKIKKTLLTSFILFFPFCLIILLIFSVNIIVKDINYSHKSHNVYVPVVNWVKYYFELEKKKIKNHFLNLNDNKKRLSAVNIYVPEKSSRALLSNVPNSTKQYVDALIDIDGNKEKAMLRYLGDNPRNWMFHKKSIRLKLRKSNLINRTRYFQFKNYEETILERYTAYLFAKNLNMLVPKVKMTELIVNDENLGVYLQTERLNESFLRRNKIMPINIYKGEAYMNSEKKIGLEFYLDQNPGLWEKISYFNMVKEDDYGDLINFFKIIKKANYSRHYLNRILKNDNLDLLAKAAILELLINSQNGDYIHNRRLALDPWSGNSYILPLDYKYNFSAINLEYNYLDQNNTNLLNTLNQSSEFINYKYNLLHKLIKEEKIFKKVRDELLEIKERYLNSKRIDLGSVNPLALDDKKNNQLFKKNFDNIISSLQEREQKLLNILEQDPKVTWEDTKKGFNIILEESAPISNLQVNFNDSEPKWIVFDYNNNKIIDEKDLYFYPNNKNKFEIDLKFFANRIAINENILTAQKKIITGRTKFSFFVENDKSPSKLYTFLNTKKNKIKLNNKNLASALPSINNLVIKYNKEKLKILSGEIFVDKDLIISRPTKILEGTTFTLKKDVSIVFENKVEAIGSDKKPIIFKNNLENNYFGTVAVHGLKTEGSVFKNIVIENATGDFINNINYFSSLSVHAAKNLIFDNLVIKNNSKYDDMMHIIYSKNIKVTNSTFLNAYKDAIDVDVSDNVLFENVTIKNSGNDGIDFMESKAELNDVKIMLSGDKGISVGENSNISIIKSIFKSNKYGLASKDSSIAKIKDSLFENNKIQLSAYKKNWRYDSSGTIKVEDSEISSKKNIITSDKFGDILILSSKINGEIDTKNNVRIINN